MGGKRSLNGVFAEDIITQSSPDLDISTHLANRRIGIKDRLNAAIQIHRYVLECFRDMYSNLYIIYLIPVANYTLA